jgi:hypothetical protein
MKKAALVLLILIVMVPGVSWATAQFPDLLIRDGETLPIFSNPLESYFDGDHQKPRHLFHFTCTACWRGYVSVWEREQIELEKLK